MIIITMMLQQNKLKNLKVFLITCLAIETNELVLKIMFSINVL